MTRFSFSDCLGGKYSPQHEMPHHLVESHVLIEITDVNLTKTSKRTRLIFLLLDLKKCSYLLGALNKNIEKKLVDSRNSCR